MREYPFTAWVLGGTFTPKQVTLVKQAYSIYKDWHRSESGKDYCNPQLFETKEQAVEEGHRRLIEQETKIAKQQQGIEKRRANLIKHS